MISKDSGIYHFEGEEDKKYITVNNCKRNVKKKPFQFHNGFIIY